MTKPGSTDRPKGRLTLRLVGGLLFLVGAAAVVAGAVIFMRGFLADDMDEMSRNGLVGVLVFGGGGVVTMLGVGALSAGFAARDRAYVATSPMPVAGEAGAMFTDAERSPGAARTVDDDAVE